MDPQVLLQRSAILLLSLAVGLYLTLLYRLRWQCPWIATCQPSELAALYHFLYVAVLALPFHSTCFKEAPLLVHVSFMMILLIALWRTWGRAREQVRGFNRLVRPVRVQHAWEDDDNSDDDTSDNDNDSSEDGAVEENPFEENAEEGSSDGATSKNAHPNEENTEKSDSDEDQTEHKVFWNQDYDNHREHGTSPGEKIIDEKAEEKMSSPSTSRGTCQVGSMAKGCEREWLE